MVQLNCTFSTDEHHARPWRVRQSGWRFWGRAGGRLWGPGWGLILFIIGPTVVILIRTPWVLEDPAISFTLPRRVSVLFPVFIPSQSWRRGRTRDLNRLMNTLFHGGKSRDIHCRVYIKSVGPHGPTLVPKSTECYWDVNLILCIVDQRSMDCVVQDLCLIVYF